MKIIVILIPTGLVTNLLLSSICSSLRVENKNLVFSKLLVWLREIFLFLFIVSLSKISVKRENIFELSVLNQISLFIEMTPGVFLRSLTIKC